MRLLNKLNSIKYSLIVMSASSFNTQQIANIIGIPSEFSELNLPTYQNILKYYIYVRDRQKQQTQKQHSYASKQNNWNNWQNNKDALKKA